MNQDRLGSAYTEEQEMEEFPPIRNTNTGETFAQSDQIVMEELIRAVSNWHRRFNQPSTLISVTREFPATGKRSIMEIRLELTELMTMEDAFNKVMRDGTLNDVPPTIHNIHDTEQ